MGVASVYRTVSELGVMVIAEMIPVALLFKERIAISKRKGEDSREVVVREEQQNESRGRWTLIFIGNLDL